MVYTTGAGVQVYIDNMVGVQQNTPTSSVHTTLRSGHIVIGRLYENNYYGKLTVDWLMI